MSVVTSWSARRGKRLNGWCCRSRKRSILGGTLHWLGRKLWELLPAVHVATNMWKCSQFYPPEQPVTHQCRMSFPYNQPGKLGEVHNCTMFSCHVTPVPHKNTIFCSKPILLLVLTLEGPYSWLTQLQTFPLPAMWPHRRPGDVNPAQEGTTAGYKTASVKVNTHHTRLCEKAEDVILTWAPEKIITS